MLKSRKSLHMQKKRRVRDVQILLITRFAIGMTLQKENGWVKQAKSIFLRRNQKMLSFSAQQQLAMSWKPLELSLFRRNMVILMKKPPFRYKEPLTSGSFACTINRGVITAY